MLFPTITFAVFLVLVLAVHTVLLERPTAWKASMLAASYVFYGWWDWRFLSLIWLSTLVDFVAGRGIHATNDTRHRRLWLSCSLGTNLGMLGFFKYAGFFVDSFVDLLASFGVAASTGTLGIILPVGISFYTFQTMSYSIDIYRRVLEPTDRLLDFALFVGFFPQLVAGPIVRARDFLVQLGTDDRAPIDTGLATKLILGGLFKKMVLADVLGAELVDGVFANPGGATGLEVLLAVYGYAFQIYGDFSGYSDIAIGIALLLGFRFPMNFDQPYRALSLQDFWRRWHISLSSWLRDYLYIGLGGNRRGRGRTARNILMTMLLGGLWHGAGWTFVLWGAIHGIGLVVERAIPGLVGGKPTPVRRMARTLVTFHLVCAGWVFFRAVDVSRAIEVFAGLGGSWTSAPTIGLGVVLLLLVGATTQFVPAGMADAWWDRAARLPVPLQAIGVIVAILVFDLLGPDGVKPFLYFAF
ncbi:MAG: MBOAT family O-acyltransferase [Actinomycetota bacterium]|nr:MBOAT family O-acyltransferase [Actinomycetota bacterium]